MNGRLFTDRKSYIDQQIIASKSDIEQLIFDTTPATPSSVEGAIHWNGTDYTLNIVTGLGAVLQVGQEMYTLIYNDSGSEIPNGTALRPNGFTAEGLPKMVPAQADHFENFQKKVCIATHNIANGTFGMAASEGRVRDLDTSAFAPGDFLWLSASTPGDMVNEAPEFPNYPIRIGCVSTSHPSEGVIFLAIGGGTHETFTNAWDGAIRESFDFRVTSNGSVVTGTLTNPATADNLTCIFSDGLYDFDCVANGSISLTSGTATNPQLNYVYIDKADKTLKVSTTEFPSTEHAKIAKIALLDAVSTQTQGALRNQNINDHIKSDMDNGHILHMAERMRQFNAQWDNGVEASLNGTPTNVQIATTGGQVWQMHKQTFVATNMATGDDVHVVNDNTTPYRTTTNLNDIDAYSDGSSWNNQWGSIVVWGIANKTGEASHVMVNLPTGGYNSEADAVADADNKTVYAIPDIFKGTGFLIARFTIRISGATFTYNSGVGYQDLRGYVPNNIAGGGSSGSGATTFLGLTDTPSAYTDQGNKLIQVNAGGTALEFLDIDASYVSDFDTEVSNNTDVAANTAYRGVGHVPLSQKAANNGVATLDAGGKIPSSQLPASVMDYQGTWNANTNTPTLEDGTGSAGDIYVVDVAGTQNLGSTPITYAVGDWAVYNGTIWEKSPHSDAVTSVNTQQGAVVLDTDDIAEGTTNKYLSATDKTDLTDAGDSALHYHATDRNRANHTGTQTASTISDFDTEVSNNASVTANTAKVTNANHTGEVTGSGALTIADNVVDEANLKLDTSPTNGYVLVADSGESGGMKWAIPTESIIMAVSDETTDLETGTAKLTFRMPYAFTLTEVRASVTTAPTGSVLTVDINEGGVSVLSTKLTIDAGEKTSTTAATAAVISDSSLADDAEITIDIDTVGSTVAGAGLKVALIGYT